MASRLVTDAAPASGRDAIRRRADPRLPAYLAAGLGALIASITTGQAEFAALGAPFVALAAIGLIHRSPVRLRGSVSLSAERVIEGDIIEGEIRLDWDGDAEITVLLTGLRGVTAIEPASASWALEERGPVRLPFQLRARSWGVHHVCDLWVRCRRPNGLLMWEQRLAQAPTLRILPTPLRLTRLLKPIEPRAVAGMHLSRFRGHGTDFAELRPYRPGDRLRDLAWATSARLGKPWVTVRHSERTGTVLLMLDAVFSDRRDDNDALARAARAAWAVAVVHLRAQDRVGLLTKGRVTAWLPPRGGRRARWLLLDELLSVGAAAEDEWQRPVRRNRVIVPTDALIIAVTSLRSHDFIRQLLHYRRAGHPSVALVMDTQDLLPNDRRPAIAAARRIWLAQRDSERQSLERAGIPTVLVSESEGVAAAISTLRRSMSAMRRSKAGALAR
jgi:uncharacterized protein (DUF58 family)